jgi:hypothetical protein
LLQNDTMNFPHIMTLKGLNTSNPGLSWRWICVLSLIEHLLLCM